MTDEDGFLNPVTDAVCRDCGYPMAMVRTDVSAPIATIARMRCSSCDSTGSVETRPEDSIANITGVIYHGAAGDPSEVETKWGDRR
jgi:hypothetical protein